MTSWRILTYRPLLCCSTEMWWSSDKGPRESSAVGLCQERQRAGLEKQITARQLTSKCTQHFNPSFLLWLCKALFHSQLQRFYFEFLSKPVPFLYICLPLWSDSYRSLQPWLLDSFLPCFLPAAAPVLVSQPLAVTLPTWLSGQAFTPLTGSGTFSCFVQFSLLGLGTVAISYLQSHFPSCAQATLPWSLCP